MSLREAREFVGKICRVQWTDRNGEVHDVQSNIYDAFCIPMYGTYLVTDDGDILVDRISSLAVMPDIDKETVGDPAGVLGKIAA